MACFCKTDTIAKCLTEEGQSKAGQFHSNQNHSSKTLTSVNNDFYSIKYTMK